MENGKWKIKKLFLNFSFSTYFRGEKLIHSFPQVSVEKSVENPF